MCYEYILLFNFDFKTGNYLDNFTIYLKQTIYRLKIFDKSYAGYVTLCLIGSGI